MSKKTILTKIIKEAQLEKNAQEAINEANQINTQDSKAYADKIFEELLRGLHINGLDD